MNCASCGVRIWSKGSDDLCVLCVALAEARLRHPLDNFVKTIGYTDLASKKKACAMEAATLRPKECATLADPESIEVRVATRQRRPPQRVKEMLRDFSVKWTCGFSDVALARNVQLFEPPTDKIVVLIDDDISITPNTLQRLAGAVRRRRAVSAMYCPRGDLSRFAITLYSDCATSGLGACAIHGADLHDLFLNSPTIDLGGHHEARVMTRSTNRGNLWLSEDHYLWSRLFHETETSLKFMSESVAHIDENGEMWWPSQNASIAETERSTLGNEATVQRRAFGTHGPFVGEEK